MLNFAVWLRVVLAKACDSAFPRGSATCANHQGSGSRPKHFCPVMSFQLPWQCPLDATFDSSSKSWLSADLSQCHMKKKTATTYCTGLATTAMAKALNEKHIYLLETLLSAMTRQKFKVSHSTQHTVLGEGEMILKVI